MKASRVYFFVMGLLLSPIVGFAQGSDLHSPKKRDAAVARSHKLLEPVQFATSVEELPSPFAPSGFDDPDPEEIIAQQAAVVAAASPGVTRPMGARGVLETLAERIVPSGILRLGGKAILLFGQKKLKVGDGLTITFEGTNYDLDITAIGSTTFTLRYQGEELTRSIKPGK